MFRSSANANEQRKSETGFCVIWHQYLGFITQKASIWYRKA